MISSDHIVDLPDSFHFHVAQHATLSMFLLNRMAEKLSFRLKLQKATIQLIDGAAFAILGFRRSQQSIFVEFFTEKEVSSLRVERTVIGRNGKLINRVYLHVETDVDSELLQWLMHSNKLVTQKPA